MIIKVVLVGTDESVKKFFPADIHQTVNKKARSLGVVFYSAKSKTGKDFTFFRASTSSRFANLLYIQLRNANCVVYLDVEKIANDVLTNVNNAISKAAEKSADNEANIIIQYHDTNTDSFEKLLEKISKKYHEIHDASEQTALPRALSESKTTEKPKKEQSPSSKDEKAGKKSLVDHIKKLGFRKPAESGKEKTKKPHSKPRGFKPHEDL